MGFHGDFDHIALSELEDPYEIIRELVDECPVRHTREHDGFWVLNRYADVSAAGRDPQLYSSQERGIAIPNHVFPVGTPPIESDPPQHAQYRGPLLSRFTPRAADAYREEARTRVNELIDVFIEQGEGDLASGLAMPLPTMIATKFLGLPVADGPRLMELATKLMTVDGDVEPIQEVIEYLAAFYEITVANPGDDLPTAIANLQIDGEQIDVAGFVTVLAVIFVAGLDTTANAGGHMLLYLARNQELRDQLIADPTRIGEAVEELLRFLTPLPLVGRTAMADVELHGETIPKGDRIGLHWMAANHDPAEFPDPDTFILGRTPNRHVTFGIGPHRCLGANLARMELVVLLEEVLRRIPDYQIAGDVSHYRGTVRGIASLPVTFTPARREG